MNFRLFPLLSPLWPSPLARPSPNPMTTLVAVLAPAMQTKYASYWAIISFNVHPELVFE